MSDDCRTNLKRLKRVVIIKSIEELPNLNSFDIIIDALFSTGLKRKLTGFIAQVVAAVNASKCKVYAVDIPSGLFCDEITNASAIVQSDVTISFQRPKKAFFFPENNTYIQWWKVIEIGLNENFIQQQKVNQYVLDKRISQVLKKRNRYSHKGSYGHSLLIVGSYGMMGGRRFSFKGLFKKWYRVTNSLHS